MTKQVRIENADNSDHKLVVEVWARSATGHDVLVETKSAAYPTAMVEAYVWKDRYLVVREA